MYTCGFVLVSLSDIIKTKKIVHQNGVFLLSILDGFRRKVKCIRFENNRQCFLYAHNLLQCAYFFKQ